MLIIFFNVSKLALVQYYEEVKRKSPKGLCYVFILLIAIICVVFLERFQQTH